ncbi:glucosamine-6-phosphate deaminase [Cellulosilyticum ruminicola]|uniref:glucosamine-6-phosphate deaminase n=1 Tax=Cellulosilyticum ruminicola TaxID=425254 RepID=UPI0006CFD4B0|nr:glucosamine-6-phosphate deaminase [Cellulosilyticum ruminicola]
MPSGIAESIEDEAHNYDEKIAQLGGIDLQILGIGNNGHIAFNEADHALRMKTHVVDLTEDTIKENARFFEHRDEVPRSAITMGVGQIMKAKKIVLLASGKGKAEAVKGILSGYLTTQNPVSFLQLHENVTLIIDEEINAAIKEI